MSINHEGNHDHSELELYGDDRIASLDAPVPFWLKCNYVFWPIFGLIWLVMFWHGSTISYFDRGYWYELQKAANTTFPSINVDELPSEDAALQNNTSRNR